jgi:hypothetical protein
MAPVGIPTVVVWALGAVGAAVLAKYVKNEWQRVNAELHPRNTARATDNVDRARLPTLRRDPKTGIYHAD